jgi:hypothetical protein
MTVLCRDATADICPKGLTICCATCGDREACPNVCSYHAEWEGCEYREDVTDELTQFSNATPEAIRTITNLVVMKKQLEDQEKQLKEDLTKAMETYGVKSFENDQIKLVYVAPTTRSTIDSVKLKKDHPDLAQQYTKTSNVSASVRITVK